MITRATVILAKSLSFVPHGIMRDQLSPEFHPPTTPVKESSEALSERLAAAGHSEIFDPRRLAVA